METAGKAHSQWFPTKALAESFRNDLIRAQCAGEAFDVASGLPMSIARERNPRTLLQVATSYVDSLWSAARAANTRRSAVMHLSAAIPLVVRQLDRAPDRDVLQRLLSTRMLPPPRRTDQLSVVDRAAASWIARASRPVSELVDDPAASELLVALGKTSAGVPVASSTWDTRRAVLHRALAFATESGWLPTNPLTGRRLPLLASRGGVGPRVVVNPVQARQLLAAVTYVTAPRRTDHRDRGHLLWRAATVRGSRAPPSGLPPARFRVRRALARAVTSGDQRASLR